MRITYRIKRWLILLDTKADCLKVDHIMRGRHLGVWSILDGLVVGERDRLDLVLLAVLDIDAELCVPAQCRVEDKAAGDGLGILAQIELLVDGDGVVQTRLQRHARGRPRLPGPGVDPRHDGIVVR